MVKSERKEAWFRIVVAIISGIILYFWGIVILIIAFLNWLFVVFSGERNKGLADFCEQWNTELYRYVRYLTFINNERPFPFTSIVGKISKFTR
jgi:hypothetical protein